MTELFRLASASDYQADIDAWLASEPAQLFSIARQCFASLRRCGDDVREVLHDGCPVACVEGAAFAYVNVFSSHVNLGFFRGACLHDPQHLLQGSGKRMRHVKIRPGQVPDAAALEDLIGQAYRDVRRLLRAV